MRAPTQEDKHESQNCLPSERPGSLPDCHPVIKRPKLLPVPSQNLVRPISLVGVTPFRWTAEGLRMTALSSDSFRS